MFAAMTPEDHLSLLGVVFNGGWMLVGLLALAWATHRDEWSEWWDAFRQDIRDAL